MIYFERILFPTMDRTASFVQLTLIPDGWGDLFLHKCKLTDTHKFCRRKKQVAVIFAFFCTRHTVLRLSYRAFLLFVLIVEAEWSTGKYGVYYFYIRDSFSLGSDEGCLI